MHMIEEKDRGIVKGGATWHNMPQYEVQEAYIEVAQARGVLAYDLAKVRNQRINTVGDMVPVDSYSIVRTDLDLELASGVGERFRILNNDVLLDLVYTALISKYDKLKIESVGTLKNGAIAFVSMQVDEAYRVTGDQSATLDRLMWYNPIGIGSYQACAHSIRIECGNTLSAAAMQGAANNSLARFPHTAGAPEAIANYTADLAGFFLSLDDLHETLDVLARTGLRVSEVTEFLQDFFEGGDSDRSKSISKGRSDKVLEQYERGDGLDGMTATSAYSLLNAVTYYFDHLPETDNRDGASITWNGLVGNAAQQKAKAYEALRSLARERC